MEGPQDKYLKYRKVLIIGTSNTGRFRKIGPSPRVNDL
jgi:hypothetical protein